MVNCKYLYCLYQMMMTKNNILAEAAEEVIGKTVVPEENLPSVLKKSLENT